MQRVTCAGCSLLCDDIIIRSDGLFIDEVIGACLKGKERFDLVTAPNRLLKPMVRKDGILTKVSWEAAIDKTIKIIQNSSKPLFYGFSNISCEAQYNGIELAKLVDGFIDSNASICQGKVLDVAVDIRKDSSTFGKHVSIELSDENKRARLCAGSQSMWPYRPSNTVSSYSSKCISYRHY